MTRKYKVYWTNIAEADLKNTIEYIAENSATEARILFNRIKAKASDLELFPERGRIVPELKDQGILLYREIIVTPWRIIYKIFEGKVLVLSLFDSRRNIEDILFDRLIKQSL